jgi:Spy/CpxP family protein refolding chaperone
MRRIFLAAVLFTAMVGLSQSSAQPDPEVFKLLRPAMQVLRTSPGVLATNPAVQKELKMDDDQVKAVKEKVPPVGFGGFGGKGKNATPEQQERMAKMFEKLQGLKDVPEDKLEAKMREAFKEELEGPTKEVEKILKPEQLTRLKQIARQQGGPGAYLTAENAKDLSLTDDQKKKLKEISNELQKDTMALFQGGFSAETREKMAMLNKEASEKAGEVLTAEQKSKWKELTGEPFTVPFGGGRPKKDD